MTVELKHVIWCDVCLRNSFEACVSSVADKGTARELAVDEGWVIRKVNGRAFDMCPECAGKIWAEDDPDHAS